MTTDLALTNTEFRYLGLNYISLKGQCKEFHPVLINYVKQ